jgi:3'(2'), 5'-bisphosphate nucleotidase
VLNSHDISQLKILAAQAGQAIMAYHKKDLGLTHKSDHSPLTLADLASHKLLFAGITALFPHIPVISEEGEGYAGDAKTYFSIDPLDGTKEFVKGTDEFTVNIALITDNYPVFGLLYAPATQQLWVSTQVSAKPLDGRKAFVSRSHIDQETKDYIATHALSPVPCGSALKFGLMVEGIAAVYPRFGPTCPWDIAAGQAILEAAGGQLLDLNGQRVRYTGQKDERVPFFIASRT